MFRRSFPFRALKAFFGLLVWSRLGLAGLALAVVSGTVLLGFFAAELLGFETGPYSGLIGLVFLPGLFVLGLLLMPIGYVRASRKLGRLPKAEACAAYPILDFNHPHVRRNLAIFGLLSLSNMVILGLASYRGVEAMESNSFCGQACQRAMGPE